MKKKIILNLFLWLPLLLWASKEEGNSLPYEQTETQRKSFPTNANTSIEIINKYGDITVFTWEKDSVAFEITITAEASKLSTAKDLFGMAEVKFTANQSMVLADLLWGQNLNAFKRSSMEVSLAAGNSQSLRIDYKVYMPAGNVLKIENRFGNIFLPELKGKTYISLYHGNLRADKIKNAKNIQVKYGDVRIDEIVEGDLEVSFGDVEVEKGGDLFIQSTSGTIEVEKAEKLHIEGTNAKFRIENVDDLTTDVTLSDIRVRKLNKKMNITSKFGDVTIDHIASIFSSANIYASNGEVSLGFDAQSTFTFDANMEKSKSVHFDSSFSIIDDDKMDNFRMVKGKKGDSTSEKLKLDTKSCSVTLEIAD